MGLPSPEETERNLALFDEYNLLKKKGLKTYELMGILCPKYKISPQRIDQIVRRERNRK